MQRTARWFALLFLGVLSAGVWAQAVMEVIPLKYRSAEEMIAVLRPLLGDQGTISGLNNQLVVRTTRANLEQVKQVLATLDRMPRQLRISVRQDADLARESSGASVSGSVEVGEHGRISVGKPSSGVQARVYSSEGQNTDRTGQSVQVLEGRQAFIRTGTSVPYRQRERVQGPSGTEVIRSTEYRDVDSGFYVLPRVNGDQVTMEISAVNDSLADRPRGSVNTQRADTAVYDSLAERPRDAVNTQRVDTVVSGRLGEWIEIGGVSQSGIERDSSILARSSDARRDDRRVLLKVEEVK